MKVLLVCTGNICRSPAAHLLLAQTNAFGPTATFSSAGTQAVVGHGLEQHMAEAFAPLDIDSSGFSARLLTAEIIGDADLILTATREHRSKVVALAPHAFGRAFTLAEYAALVELLGTTDVPTLAAKRSLVATQGGLDIADPYRRGGAANIRAARQIASAVERIAALAPGQLSDQLTGPRANRILLSVPEPRPTTNPYVSQLIEQLRTEPGLTVDTFTWIRGLFGKYDVFHVHWPDATMTGGSPFRTRIRQLLFGRVVRRFAKSNRAVVRTVHNTSPHESVAPARERALQALDRSTALQIILNPTTSPLSGAAVRLIPHSDYRHWYGKYPVQPIEPNRLGFFGLIREYKNVADLVTAFGELDGDYRLSIGGRADPAELGSALQTQADADPRVELALRHLSDAELVDLITRSALIVLPYRDLHNSGSALAALSLDRPVLVPRNGATDALAEEVGLEWVQQFEGELTATALAKALVAVEATRGSSPNLSNRSWQLAGRQHLNAYNEALLADRNGA